jgi:hypothetical protein
MKIRYAYMVSTLRLDSGFRDAARSSSRALGMMSPIAILSKARRRIDRLYGHMYEFT